MIDSRLLGDIAEQKFILLCIQNNISVFKPINSNSRIDFIIEHKDKFKKVQVKYRSILDGKLCLQATKQQNGRNKTLKYTKNEIDMFLVYEPSSDQFYNVPIDMFLENNVHVFRVDSPKNSQTKGVKYLKDFIFNISSLSMFFALCIFFSGCSTCQFKSSEDYYKDRQRLIEDSIDWGPNSNNNMMNSPDGSVYYNRTIHVFGATY